MSLRIDNDLNLTDISNGYTPDIDGSPAGSIFYRLPELSAGNHTATLRISGHSRKLSLSLDRLLCKPRPCPRDLRHLLRRQPSPHPGKLLRDPQPPRRHTHSPHRGLRPQRQTPLGLPRPQAEPTCMPQPPSPGTSPTAPDQSNPRHLPLQDHRHHRRTVIHNDQTHRRSPALIRPMNILPLSGFITR